LSYEVNCTDNAEEVLAFLEQNKWDKNSLPDIILLDIYMPQFNGWEFLEKVQDLYPTLVKPLKIYILSSSINPADITYSRQYSCVKSFLFKPITRKYLNTLLKKKHRMQYRLHTRLLLTFLSTQDKKTLSHNLSGQ